MVASKLIKVASNKRLKRILRGRSNNSPHLHNIQERARSPWSSDSRRSRSMVLVITFIRIEIPTIAGADETDLTRLH